MLSRNGTPVLLGNGAACIDIYAYANSVTTYLEIYKILPPGCLFSYPVDHHHDVSQQETPGRIGKG